MRTLVDLPQEQLEALTRLSEMQGSSRAALIREAIGEYLAQRQTSDLSETFGLWRDRAVDGLMYQRQLRDEWE